MTLTHIPRVIGVLSQTPTGGSMGRRESRRGKSFSHKGRPGECDLALCGSAPGLTSCADPAQFQPLPADAACALPDLPRLAHGLPLACDGEVCRCPGGGASALDTSTEWPLDRKSVV